MSEVGRDTPWGVVGHGLQGDMTHQKATYKEIRMEVLRV